jgi:Fe-S cluster assembly ATP-binding protein
MESEVTLLELKDITYVVKGKTILSGLSLSIASGEVHALLGTNGTGKSTLAYLVMGCEGYRPESGEILFEGQEINDLKIHERAKLGITMAWQEPVRFEGIAVRDYLALKKKDIDPAHYLEMVGLHPELYLHRMVDKSLSGGERKRIELASILALHPKLAILDEPDSGIDMLSTQDIVNVISAFKNNGSSVLLITHREEIVLIADRASQICNGKIVCTGNPGKVAEYYKSRKCFVCDGEVCVYV